jgi:hypothetical protein
MTPKLENLALQTVRQTFPDLQRGGFLKALREIAPYIQPREFKFIPDGWFMEIDRRSRKKSDWWHTFNCIEIEDSHTLIPSKLWAYCELWWHLDDPPFFGGGINLNAVNLRLFVFDRYGLSRREIDLARHYFDGCREMAAARKAAA